MAVSRAVKRGRSYNLVFSDRYTCLLTFQNLPRRREGKGEQKVVWNLEREGGWDRYKELTEEFSENLGRIIEGEGSIETKIKIIDRTHDKIKYKAFGKVRIGRGAQKQHEGEAGKEVNEEGKARKAFEEQAKKAVNEIKEI